MSYMRVTPAKRITSATWGLPPPYKQALRCYEKDLSKKEVKQRLLNAPLVKSLLSHILQPERNDPFNGVARVNCLQGRFYERKSFKLRKCSSTFPFIALGLIPTPLVISDAFTNGAKKSSDDKLALYPPRPQGNL